MCQLEVDREPTASNNSSQGPVPAFPVRVGLFRFRLLPEEPLYLPALSKSNVLRGSFGTVFRQLCCIPHCVEPRRCPREDSCPYKLVFAPSPPANSAWLSRNQDIPRPFVFRAKETPQTRFERSEAFEFDLVLVGQAVQHLSYFVLSFREAGRQGIGLNRAKCIVDRVAEQSLDGKDCRGLVYQAGVSSFAAPAPVSLERWIQLRLGQIADSTPNTNRKCVRIRFLTPTRLQANGEPIRNPEFHHVVRRLRDRVNALATFFEGTPLQIDFRGLGERAQNIRRVGSEVHWADRFRTSSKTGQRHELSGFVGDATYEGDISEFLPWLLAGELLHVGKHTAWGNGRIEVSLIDSVP